MFHTSPSMFASTVIVVFTTLVTLGFALIWLVFAATLFVGMGVSIWRTIPREEI